MIIDFSNINGGGGGYVLPVASQDTLGGVKINGNGLSIDSAGTLSAETQVIGVATTATTGVVKIGSGINVDSAGTISVEASSGGGIEVVSSLPASGTDGQMVLLETNITDLTLIVSRPTDSSSNISVTGIGLTNDIAVYNYEWFGERDYVTLKTDHSVSIYSSYDDSTTEIPADGEAHIFYMKNGIRDANVTFTVTSTGFTTSQSESITKENVVYDIIRKAEEIQVLYTWSDNPAIISSADYTLSSMNDGCIRFKYSMLPSGTLAVVKNIWDTYHHIVVENNELHVYQSDSASTYTATTYGNIGKYNVTQYDNIGYYFTDDEIIVFAYNWWCIVQSVNTSALYKTGWHKVTEHRISNRVVFKDYTWYDEDNGIIIKSPNFPLYNVGLTINPNSQYATMYEIYSKNDTSIGPIFAPTTTGTTGQVCIAGNGYAAPTWTNPENLTGGVKFWKGTQTEYDNLSTYDSSTLYIIIPE